VRRRAFIALVAVLALAGCSSDKTASPATVPLGSSTTIGATVSPCKAWRDAANAAGAVFYANEGHYPSSFAELTTSKPPTLQLTDGVTAAAVTLHGAGFTLTMSGGGATVATFACHPPV
jgi:hypothetical protein